ncbi:MAG: hypothetical protein QXX68_02825 [Candidatus Pacearchaeota archaeon]
MPTARRIIRALEKEINNQIQKGKSELIRLIYMPYCIFYEICSEQNQQEEIVERGEFPFSWTFLRNIKKIAKETGDYFSSKGIPTEVQRTDCYIHPV